LIGRADCTRARRRSQRGRRPGVDAGRHPPVRWHLCV